MATPGAAESARSRRGGLMSSRTGILTSAGVAVIIAISLYRYSAQAQTASCPAPYCNSPSDSYSWYSSVAPANVKPSSQVFCGKDTLKRWDSSTQQVVWNEMAVDATGRCLALWGTYCTNFFCTNGWTNNDRRPAVLAEIRGGVQKIPFKGLGGPPLTFGDDGEQEYPMSVSLDIGWTPTPEVLAAQPPVVPINTLQAVLQYMPAFNVSQFGGRQPGGQVWGGLGTAVVHIELNAWSKGRTWDS